MEVSMKISMEVSKIDSQNLSKSMKKSGAQSTFATLLAEKKSNIRRDIEAMNQLREEIKFNQNLHEELTGQKVDEPIDESSAIVTNEIETIKHILPDGSIRVIQMQGNQIVSQITIDADDFASQMF